MNYVILLIHVGRETNKGKITGKGLNATRGKANDRKIKV